MYKFSNQNFFDFSFNGSKLSDHGGYVGSADGGIKTYSVLPSRSYTTDKPLGTDITTVYASSLEPRDFEVPVVFDTLDDGKLREIAMWLDSPTPSKFQWVGDTVYINACLDGSAFDAESSSGIDGQIPLKFTAFDPFFYNITQSEHTIGDLTSGQSYAFENQGYGELPPYITITCSGDIKIEVLDSEEKVYTTTNVTGITGGVKIDSTAMECTLMSGASHFSHIDTFPMIPQGNFKIKITGNTLTNMQLNYRERYL